MPSELKSSSEAHFRSVAEPVLLGSPLIIAGMHRSGTSMAAQALHRAGLHLGEHLLPASRHNAEGYFEDVEIIALHEKIFAINGTTWHEYGSRMTSPLTIPAAIHADARQLLSRKALGRTCWGWKDPRTTIFLDFWFDLLPDARFLFVFREPAEVLWSLVRRGDSVLKGMARSRLMQGYLSLRLWTFYNRKLVRFVRKHQDRCVLLSIPDDIREATRTTAIDAILRQEWGYGLNEVDFAGTYTGDHLTRAVPLELSTLARLYPPAITRLRELRELNRELFVSRAARASRLARHGTG